MLTPSRDLAMFPLLESFATREREVVVVVVSCGREARGLPGHARDERCEARTGEELDQTQISWSIECSRGPMLLESGRWLGAARDIIVGARPHGASVFSRPVLNKFKRRRVARAARLVPGPFSHCGYGLIVLCNQPTGGLF